MSSKNVQEFNNKAFISKIFKKGGAFQIGEACGKRDFLCSLLGFASVLLALISYPSHALAPNALPTGYQSIAGNVQFDKQGNTLNVNTNTNSSIANYQTFNVGQNAAVNFYLPGNKAAILNRVTGGTGSEIYGAINTPNGGQIFLVNDAGILFGETAQVTPGSLFASTIPITDENFLSGNYLFSGGSNSAIVNKGTIKVAEDGSVVFIGAAIQNFGDIDAPNGNVNFAVGDTVRLSLNDGVLMDVTIDEALKNKAEGYQQAILNAGTITADGGNIKLQAELQNAFYDSVVNNEGVIQAVGIKENNGVIELVAKSNDGLALAVNSGGLVVSNETGKGGKVKVLGDYVAITEDATIDASGETGGGEILIGGDYRGENPEIQNAKKTYVGEDVTIKADAYKNGDGGKVVVWADNTTVFNGDISVQGGDESGNGGFVETSGKEKLAIGKTASVNALAKNGKAGDWLLDPRNITIQAGGDTTITLAQLADSSDTTSDYIVDTSVVEGASANVILEATEDITFYDSILMTNNGVGITANAGDDINVNASITTLDGDVNLNADSDNSGVGNVNISTTGSIDSGTAAVTFDGQQANLLNGSSVNAGDVTFNSNQTDISGIVTATGDVNATTRVAFGVDATGSVNATNVNLNTDQATIDGTINADTVTINLLDNTKDIALGGTSADSATQLGLSESELQNINATTVNIGTLTDTGSFTINGSLNVSTNTVPYDLNLANASEVVFAAGSSTVMDGDLRIDTDVLTIDGTLSVGTNNITVVPTDLTKDINIGADIDDSATLFSIDEAELANIDPQTVLFTVGSVDVTGGLSVASDVDVDFNLTLQGANIDLQGNDINVNNNNLVLTAAQEDGEVNIDGVLNANNINITGDQVIIDTTIPGTAVNGTNSVTIAPATARPIEVGGTSADSVGPNPGDDLLSITAAELAEIDTNNLTIGSTALGGGLETGGDITGDFNLTLQNLDSVTVNHNIDLSAGANSITLIADDIAISTAISINAPTRATLHQATNGRNIDLGADDDFANGGLEISDAELDRITTDVIQVGNANTGDITVTQQIDPDNSPTLRLIAGGTVIDTGAGRIIEDNLAVTADGLINLNSGQNNVDNFAGSSSTNDIRYRDADDLTISTVDGIVGVDASDDVRLESRSTGTQDDLLTINQAVVAGDRVDLIADNMDINSTVTAGGRAVILQSQNGTLIDVGGADANGVLGLDNSEIDNVTANIIQIGNGNSGNLTVTDDIAPAGTTRLSLRSGGDISQTGSITENRLAIRAEGNVILDNANNDVDRLSGDVDGLGNSFTYVDADDLIIRNEDGRDGITTNNGVVNVTTIDGDMTLHNRGDINAGDSVVNLTAQDTTGSDNAIIEDTGAEINANGGVNLVADNMDLQGSITANGGTVTINQFEDGTNIDLGGADAAGVLGLTDAELDGITANRLEIGNSNSGNITVTSTIDPANVPTLALETGGTNTISQDAGAGVVVTNLEVKSDQGEINLSDDANDVSTFMANTNGADVQFTDNNGFSLLNANLDNNNTGNPGNLTLKANSGTVDQVGATGGIDANNLTLLTNDATFILDNQANDINVLTINPISAGQAPTIPTVTFHDSDGLQISNIDLANGSLNVVSDSSGTSVDNNGTAGSGIELIGDISAADVDLTSRVGDITQTAGSIQGVNLSLTAETDGATATIENADFTNLTANTNNGDVTFYDFDGVTINDSDLGDGTFTVTTFEPTVTANNSIVEADMTLDGDIFAENIFLTANAGDINQSSGSVQGGFLDLTTDTGNATLLSTTNDFETLKMSSNGGNFSVLDQNGFDFLASNIGSGVMDAETSGNLNVQGNLLAGQVNLKTTKNGDINLNTHTLRGLTSIDIDAAGKVNTGTRFNYPKLIAPNIIVRGDKVADISAPLGIWNGVQTGFILDRSNQTGFGPAPSYIFGGSEPINAIQNLLLQDGAFFLYPIIPVDTNNIRALTAQDDGVPVVATARGKLGSSNVGRGDFFVSTSGETFLLPSETKIAEAQDFVNASGKNILPSSEFGFEEQGITSSPDFVKASGKEVTFINTEEEYTFIYTGTVLPINNAVDFEFSRNKGRELTPSEAVNDDLTD